MLFTNARAEINAQLLLMCGSVEVTRNSNAQDQNTLALGWAGKSPGAPKMMINFNNAVPSVGGFEFDPGPVLASLTEVTVTVYTDTQFITTVGFINQDSFKKAVDQNASLDFQMECKVAQWQDL